MVRRAALLLTSLLVGAAARDPSPMLRAFRARDWAAAETLARAGADPLALTLVDFVRLITPGQAGAEEIDRFLAAHPDWPDAGLLLRRREEALVAEADPARLRALCAARPPVGAAALTACADAALQGGAAAAAAGDARAAWPGVPERESAAFLARWAAMLRPEDDWRRFQRLAAAHDPAAAAAVARLDRAHAAAAGALLALRSDAPDAPMLLAAVPPALAGDPALVLAQARWLRRAGALDAAASLWAGAAGQAEHGAVPAGRAAFWSERDALARALLDAGKLPAARAVAEDDDALPEQHAESLFLTGWLALQFAHDPGDARARFAALEAAAHSVQTRARAAYWLGRAAAAMGEPAAAREAYARAAALPVTFYGQCAAAALGRPAALPDDPPASATATLQFAATVPVRAAVLLAGWGDPKRARDFLMLAARHLHDPADFTLAARQATALDLPDMAVAIARLAGRQGIMLPHAGWPLPVAPPPGAVPPALVLGLVRQESSFDPAIVSGAGAVGLMQLRPATAAAIGARHGAPNLADPATNLRLGTAYLGTMLAQFDNNTALALAAYDAGPHRAAEWRDAHGEPAGAPATIDWIERIPFAETRGYVQRVIENAAVYAAQAGGRFDAFAG